VAPVKALQTPGSGGPERQQQEDETRKVWAFESAVEKALWWVLRSTIGRALRLVLSLWRRSSAFRITAYVSVVALAVVGIVFTGVRTYENRHERIQVGPGTYELSPRGDRFSVYTSKGIEVWDLEEQQRIGVIRDEDQDLDFMSPDGRLLAGQVQHGKYPEYTFEDIRIRRVKDGSEVRMIDTREGVGWPEWSPDGELLAAATMGTVRVWRVRDGSLLAIIEGYHPTRDSLSPIVWAPDGGFLATKGDRGGISLWNVGSGRHIRTLDGKFESGISFSPDGRLFAEGGPTVKLRSMTDGRLVRELRSRGPSGPVYSGPVLAFSRDGELVATGGVDGWVRLWRVDDGKLLKTYSGHGYNETDHTSSVLAVAFFPDGRHIASYGSDETVRIWPVEEGDL
jgi:WD40 repeat protein